MRACLAGVSLIALFTVAGASACGIGDEPLGRWSLDHREYHGEGGLPFLSPSNDSRLNLRLLMLDAHPLPAASSDHAETTDLAAPPLFSIKQLDGAARSPSDYGVSFGGTQFADGEGTRCVSDASGKQAFLEAVKADAGVSNTERDLLMAARTTMISGCGADQAATDGVDSLSQNAGLSPSAREFTDYLTGAKAFYKGDFDLATASLGKLDKAGNPWLREAARYMAARILLNKAQVGAFAALDGAAQPKVVDSASLAASEAGFKNYLSAYPTGRYAASARGLLRRVYWLAGDQTRLSAEYGWRLNHARDPQANLDDNSLAQEVDTKFISAGAGQVRDPDLLAVDDLMRLRTAEPSDYYYWGSAASAKPVLTEADLAAQEPDFKTRENLFAFLRAARAYYADGDAAATLRLLGPAQPGPTQPGQLSPPFLAFSREALRGQALMASKQWPEAIDHWTRLLPLASERWQREAVELGLAMSWERAGTLNKVFAPDSPITSPRIRAILLRFSAGPILLREAVANSKATPAEQGLAHFVLLFKEATRGQYVNFLKDDAGVIKDIQNTPYMRGADNVSFAWPGQHEPYPCASLRGVIGELQSNPGSAHGKLCIAEFVRFSDLDNFERDEPTGSELGGGKSIFPGAAYSRGEVYKLLIDAPSTPRDDRAYALFRAINCYAPNGDNRCGGKDVDKTQRKAWFQMLKAGYGATPWAQKLKYYW